ncbi:hypothetical protein GCM10010517_07880 [Streptosporangium fragile]|uniref:ABC transporter ATP-binding protein n=1 Tax=Streptosporangium fragile TaxID=46186 RepID=A0ABN3VQJ2_9ACTN
MTAYAVRLNAVTKIYRQRKQTVHALRGITIDLPRGAFTCAPTRPPA